MDINSFRKCVQQGEGGLGFPTLYAVTLWYDTRFDNEIPNDEDEENWEDSLYDCLISGNSFNFEKFLMIVASSNYIEDHSVFNKKGEVCIYYKGIIFDVPVGQIFETREEAERCLNEMGYRFFKQGFDYYKNKLKRSEK